MSSLDFVSSGCYNIPSFGKVANLLIFIVEHDIWKKDMDLENTKKIVKEFKERMGVEIKRQEKL